MKSHKPYTSIFMKMFIKVTEKVTLTNVSKNYNLNCL